MVRLEDLSLYAGDRTLVSGVDWSIRPGEKIGLCGLNGCGKTTLLRTILGEVSPAAGRVRIRPGLAMGYLPQEGVAGSHRTAWDEARSAMLSIQALEARVEAAQARIEQGDENAADELALAIEAYRLAGGYAADERVGAVLHGLGFSPADWQKPCDTFSGGWQMRVALARVLLSTPDLIILDEPTNHLDLPARSYLARFLATAPEAVVLVTHDRHLLASVPRRIAEIRQGKLDLFNGGFLAWESEREIRQEQAETAFRAQQREIARLTAFVTRFKAKPTKASQARSRQKELDRMEATAAPVTDKLPRMRIPKAPHCSSVAIALVGAAVGWPDEPPVLSGVNLALERGLRLAVLGPNGSGKTTLLKALQGVLALSAGRRTTGTGVSIGVFSQASASELPGDESALTWLLTCLPRLDPERGRSVLGALGLSGDAALRPIAELSGGERSRAALARLVLVPHNVLLLDEPTNHLDAVTSGVLARSLAEFDGALALVTHDRALVETVANAVARVGYGRVDLHEGVEAEDFEPPQDLSVRAPEIGRGAQEYAASRRRAREKERLLRRCEEIGKEIDLSEAEISRLDAELCSASTGADYHRVTGLASQRGDLVARIEALFREWEEVERKLAEDG
jgi:ATP-binding cassette, subfamily F, member 3